MIFGDCINCAKKTSKCTVLMAELMVIIETAHNAMTRYLPENQKFDIDYHCTAFTPKQNKKENNMYRVIDGNNTGKTYKLLAECGRNNGLYVCEHPERAAEKCAAYGLPIVRAIGFDDWERIARNSDGVIDLSMDIYIDELEKFVKYFIPYLKGYTLTNN